MSFAPGGSCVWMSDAVHLALRRRVVGVTVRSTSGRKRGMKGRKIVTSGIVVVKQAVEASEQVGGYHPSPPNGRRLSSKAVATHRFLVSFRSKIRQTSSRNVAVDPQAAGRTCRINPVRTVRPTMISLVGKARTDLVCARCSKRVKWAWVVEYRSFHFVQFIYLCSECASVIKVTKEDVRHSTPAGDDFPTCFDAT
jgi:hypothetical protein